MTTAPGGRPGRRGPRPAPRAAAVVRTQRLSPSMVRVVLGGPELASFPGPGCADAYVKLMFPRPGVSYPRPLDPQRWRAELPPQDQPVVRTYTIRAWEATTGELTVDFVVHGTDGVAGPWAAGAQVGDEVFVAGPGGAWSPDPTAAWHLFVGDESALPAIAVALEQLPEDAVGAAFVEVADPTSVLPVRTPSGVRLEWLRTEPGRRLGDALVDAVTALPLGDGGSAFVHGEAGFVKQLRRVLRVDRGMPVERLSISGYWRVGDTDEAWRAGKAAWAQEAEAAERTAGVA